MSPVSDTPKATLAFGPIGKGFGKDQVSAGIVNKVTYKKDKVSAYLQASNVSVWPVKNIQTLKDLVANVDYKLPKSLTLNANYELGTKKYKGGLTWDGKIQDKSTTAKVWYTNKDNLVAGEATIQATKSGKVNVTGNQKQVLTAKYTHTQGSLTIEPSYNFTKKSPAVALTKKVKKEAIKVSYDLKSEGAAVEWAHTPFKVTLSAALGPKAKLGKPTLSAVYEKTFDF